VISDCCVIGEDLVPESADEAEEATEAAAARLDVISICSCFNHVRVFLNTQRHAAAPRSSPRPTHGVHRHVAPPPTPTLVPHTEPPTVINEPPAAADEPPPSVVSKPPVIITAPAATRCPMR